MKTFELVTRNVMSFCVTRFSNSRILNLEPNNIVIAKYDHIDEI